MDNKTSQFRLNEFQHYQNQSLCDVVLLAERDGTRIHSHRLTLSSASDFFKCLFTNEMREKDMNEIVLKEVDGDILQQLVEYCYTGEIQLKFENIGRLIASASMYQVLYLENEIWTFLRAQIENETCLSIWSIGRQYNCKDVDQLAFHFACENFSDVVNCEEFLVLGIELLMELLSSKDLEVNSEEEVFTAIEKWTRFDSVERLQYVKSLIETIRMSDITYEFLHENILGFCKHFELYEIFLKTCELKTRAKGKTSDRVGKLRGFLAVGGSEESVLSIEKYDSMSNSWSMFHEIPANLKYCCSEIVGNQLFVVGGMENRVPSNKTHCLSLDCLKHEYKDTMTVARLFFATVVLGDCIYAIGGLSRGGVIPSVERYNIMENNWSVVASMSSRRGGHSAVVLSNKIYVVGGYNGSHLASVECYNPETNIWSAVASMNVRRHGLSCCVVNGYICAVGGYDGSNELQSIEKYDEMLDKWILIDQTLGIPRYGFGISIHQNWIYACGGGYNNNNNINNRLEKVNIATGERVQLSSMNQERVSFQLLSV